MTKSEAEAEADAQSARRNCERKEPPKVARAEGGKGKKLKRLRGHRIAVIRVIRGTSAENGNEELLCTPEKGGVARVRKGKNEEKCIRYAEEESMCGG